MKREGTGDRSFPLFAHSRGIVYTVTRTQRRKEKIMNRKEFKWAVAGTGWIASDMAEILKKHNRHFCCAVSGHPEHAASYADKYQVPKICRTIRELCEDPEVDAVYVATPHNTHYEIAKQALTAGKHCLIEKSITLNSRELKELTDLAEEKKLCIAEAMTTWHMPLMKEVKKLVDSGELGKVQVISVNFGSIKPYDMENRFFNLKYAGGALLDIGVYALSAIRMFLTEKPSEICSQWKLCAAGSDEEETILLKNASGQLASAVISLHSKQPKRAMISCEKGYIEIMEYPRAVKAVITDAITGEKRVLEAGDASEALYYEILDFEQTLYENSRNEAERRSETEAMPTGEKTEEAAGSDRMQLQFTIDNMEVMTALRKEWKMKYPGEKW